MKKDEFKYIGSIESKVVRIQVFSFSKLAVPFYWMEGADGEVRKFGGSVIGRLAEMEDPIFEAKEESAFIYNIAYPLEKGESILEYEYATAYHSIVADSGEIDGRVLIDVFVNKKGECKYCVGGSNIIYRKKGEGIQLLIDEVELERMQGRA